MIIGYRIRAIREQKNLCQIDLAVRAGLLRSYISHIEDGEAVPDVEALDRIATALEIPLYKLFYDGDEPPSLPNLPSRRTGDAILGEGAEDDVRDEVVRQPEFGRMYQSFRSLVVTLTRNFGKRKPGQ